MRIRNGDGWCRDGWLAKIHGLYFGICRQCKLRLSFIYTLGVPSTGSRHAMKQSRHFLQVSGSSPIKHGRKSAHWITTLKKLLFFFFQQVMKKVKRSLLTRASSINRNYVNRIILSKSLSFFPHFPIRFGVVLLNAINARKKKFIIAGE